MVKAKNPHDGHRGRVKLRFLKEGLHNFAPHEVIELLLFFGIPVKRVKGISDHVASLICFCCQLSHRYYEDKLSFGTVLNSIHEVGQYILPKFLGLKNEAVVLLSMDNRRKVLNCTTIFEGSVNAMSAAWDNWLTGHAFPSADEIESTKILVKAMALADVRLVDHIIISEDDFVSMAQTPSLQYIFT